MNSTYFQDTDAQLRQLAAGFNSVMTRAQWKGVVDFSRAVDAKIVTSFSTSAERGCGGHLDAGPGEEVCSLHNASGWQPGSRRVYERADVCNDGRSTEGI